MICFDYDSLYFNTSRESARSFIESYSDCYENTSTSNININSTLRGSEAKYSLTNNTIFCDFIDMNITGELPYDSLESFMSFLGDKLECEVRYSIEQTEENDFEELMLCYKDHEFKIHKWLEMNDRNL